jgi:hypothetical protein
MGNVSAKNTVNQVTNAFVDIAVTTIQDSSTSADCSQVISTVGCNNVHIHDINMKCATIQSNQSLLTADMKTSIDQKFKETAKETAETINQNFSLNPSSTSSENTLNLVNNLGQTIKHTFINTCQTSIRSEQAIHCQDSTGVEIDHIIMDTLQSSFTSCVGNDKSVIDAKQQLETHLEQTSKSTVQDSVAWILLATAAVIIAAAIYKGGGISIFAKGGSGSGFSTKKVIITLLIAILSYTYTYLDCNDKHGAFPPRWCTTNTTMWIAYTIITLVTIIIFLV